MSTSTIEKPKIVSQEEWLAAREELLTKEKQLTRERDAKLLALLELLSTPASG